MSRGKYIVLEGAEGVGKTTQLLELARRLEAAGLPVRTMREPDSQSDVTARALRRLTQDPSYPMTTATEVLLYNAARSQSLQAIRQSVENGIICLVDRNYLTTLALQYYGRGDVPDYDTINRIIAFAVQGLEPDLCVVLDAPVATIIEHLNGRATGERYDNLDPTFLERVRAGYLWEAKQRNLPVVFATGNREDVANDIWQLVSKTLAIRDHLGTSSVSQPTPLKDILQNRKLPVPHEPPVALPSEAHLAGDNTLPATAPAPTAISSTAQTCTLTGVSSLLAARLRKLSSPTIRVTLNEDQGQGEQGPYPFYIPSYLDKVTRQHYITTMEQIFAEYRSLLQELTAFLKRHAEISAKEIQAIASCVLPVATSNTVEFTSLDSALEALTEQSSNENLLEAQELREALLTNTPDGETRREHVSSSNEQISTSKLATEYLPNTVAAITDPVTLSGYSPRNELELTPEILYEYSDQPFEVIQDATRRLTYEQKMDVIRAYIREWSHTPTPGKALDAVRYTWDLVSEFGTFYSLQPFCHSALVTRQALTPRLGYDMPSTIEEAGLADTYERCYDLSLGLYSHLQQAGYTAEAQYAVLHNHRMRWRVNLNAREVFTIFREFESSSSNHFTYQWQQRLSEIHPVIAECIQLNHTSGKETPLMAAEHSSAG